MSRELADLRECTFAPALPPAPAPEPSAPIVVRGLGRHLELKHQAIKQRQDRQEREREVFSVSGVESLRRAEDGGTIVRPFALSAAKEGKQSAAVVELLEGLEAECTFRPVTSHVLRREVMARQARAVF